MRMHCVLASERTKHHADKPLPHQASPARKMNMKHGPASQGEEEHLEKRPKIDNCLYQSAASLRASCVLVPGVPGERGDLTKSNVAREMSTYQLDHPRNATLHARRWPHTCYSDRFHHRVMPLCDSVQTLRPRLLRLEPPWPLPPGQRPMNKFFPHPRATVETDANPAFQRSTGCPNSAPEPRVDP